MNDELSGGGSRPTPTSQRARRRLDPHTLLLLAIAVAVFSAMSLARPRIFPTGNNLASMSFQVSELGILTLGMMLAILIGGIDLSINATANLAAILAGMTMTWFIPGGTLTAGNSWFLLVALAVGLVTGILCGLLNGYLIGYIRVPAILATLSTMSLYMGLAFGITGGTTVSGFPEAVLFLGNGQIAGVPVPLLIFIGALLVVWFLLNRTTFGFKVYMLGTNPLAAEFSGVNNRRVILATHVWVSALAAVAGMVALARTNSANADYGVSYILLTILIAVLGGVAVSGGHGNVWGIALALITLQFLSTGFNMLLVRHGGSNFFRDFAWGVLLLGVMTATQLINRYWPKFAYRRASGRRS